MRLTFWADIDPKDLAVNVRFLSNSALPKVVRVAKESLSAISREEMQGQNPGWRQSKLDGYIVSIDFYYADNRNDCDSALKRALDAICEGAGINDGRVKEIHVRQFVSERVGIDIDISQCLPWDYDRRAYKSPKRRPEPPWEEDHEQREEFAITD